MTYDARCKFAENILRIMQEKSITSKELATRIGGSTVMISQWINCHHAPRLENLAALAIALGVSVSELLKDIDLGELV